MKEIKSTKDYSKFRKYLRNRPLNEMFVKELMASIQANNKLEHHPIVGNAQFEVVDGQHRLEAAKRLNLSVYYVIDLDFKDEDLILVAATGHQWIPGDYLNFYCEGFNPDYIRLKNFIADNDLSIKEMYLYAFSMSLGHKSGSNSNYKIFRKGLLKFDEEAEANAKLKLAKLRSIFNLIETKSFKQLSYSKNYSFKHALVRIIEHPNYDHKHFLDRLETKLSSLRHCATLKDFYENLKEIYNWKSQYARID